MNYPRKRNSFHHNNRSGTYFLYLAINGVNLRENLTCCMPHFVDFFSSPIAFAMVLSKKRQSIGTRIGHIFL
jgi:hypothetical protein